MIELSKKAVQSPNIGKHGKRKKTIEKEKRRALFDEIISQDFPNWVARAGAEYNLNQFIGKAPDKTEITGKDGKDLFAPSPALEAFLKKYANKRS